MRRKDPVKTGMKLVNIVYQSGISLTQAAFWKARTVLSDDYQGAGREYGG